MSQPKTLYLIDGHAQIFRAYYAIRSGMTSPVTGEPTNATFAFTAMLLKLFSQLQPDFVAMAVDSPGKTFRSDIYDQYKANRDQPPEDLVAQFGRIFEITRLFGIPILESAGAEADDVIATVARELTQTSKPDDIGIRIVSKDKDLEQLLSGQICLYDIHSDTLTTTDTLKKTKGIAPWQVIDALTLTGDTVDNIPA